jgi:hypothetical protein
LTFFGRPNWRAAGGERLRVEAVLSVPTLYRESRGFIQAPGTNLSFTRIELDPPATVARRRLNGGVQEQATPALTAELRPQVHPLQRGDAAPRSGERCGSDDEAVGLEHPYV